MTAQFLHNELTNLLQEAKRKNSDLRAATEKSLADIKPLIGKPEQQVAGELAQNSGFVAPLIIACGTKNVKFTTTAVGCLQRLIAIGGLAKARLKDVLEAFREATHLGVDVQLKILQALPPLLQNYAAHLQGELLSDALYTCAILQASKSPIINNTAAATLQQLVISVFDKVVIEDDKPSEDPSTTEVTIENEKLQLRTAALDAYRVFNDLSLLTDGQKAQFIQFSQLSQTFGLELIESVISNHSDVFLSHPEQAHILRKRVVPLVIRSLSDRTNFATTVRIMRVLYIILRRHLSILDRECEVALGLLTYMLDPDAATQWKRALCMEIVKGVFAEPALVRKIYTLYDSQKGRRPIIRDISASLTKLATEKPSIIGLGTQSSAPMGQSTSKDSSGEQAALEAGGVAGIIGAVGSLTESSVSGLSTQWSLMRVPCIDHLDKTESPSIPDSYIYCLALQCINSFSEGLAKFILPITSSSDGSKGSKKKKIKLKKAAGGDSDAASGTDTPTRSMSPAMGVPRSKSGSFYKKSAVSNPLNMQDHPLKDEIAATAGLIENCWPALLACYSTFLNATLDSDLYHALVRSLQKFTQAAGVLRLTTPRDAFLTTLGKASVPSNILSASVAAHPTHSENNHGIFANAKGLLSVDSFASTNTSASDRSSTTVAASSHHQETASAVLNTRNLLCLRALLNLGMVLGASLEDSWTIILETLQNADYVLYTSSRKGGRTGGLSRIGEAQRSGQDQGGLMTNIGQEMTAVENAAMRMFDSTKEFHDDAFVSLLNAMCKLLGLEEQVEEIGHDNRPPSSGTPVSSTPAHRRFGSRNFSISAPATGENAFVLTKLGEIAHANIYRILGPEPSSNGWNIIERHLVIVAASKNATSILRLKATEVLNSIVISTAKVTATGTMIEDKAEIQERILGALYEVIRRNEYSIARATGDAKKTVEIDIHRATLESLFVILEQSGESLVAGWSVVFKIIRSAFEPLEDAVDSSTPMNEVKISKPLSASRTTGLVKSAFNSLQLICSDFLSTLSVDCVLILVDILYDFCHQPDDLNIALTTITFFWNVSDFLQSRNEGKGSVDMELPKSEEELMEQVRNPTNENNLNMNLWMVLLLRLAGVGQDPRSEVRNGSIQTLFRIFDTYGHQLGPRSWNCCLNIVIFKMMHTEQVIEIMQSSEEHQTQRKQWDETLNLVLTGIGTLYANYLQTFVQQPDFDQVWNALIVYIKSLLEWKSLDVNTNIFKELGRILEQIKDPQELPNNCKDKVWEVWASQGSTLVRDITTSNKTGVQETLKAYVESYKPLYVLLAPDINAAMIEKTLLILRDCLLYPDAPPYFSDVEVLTPLQTSIMSVLKLIRTDVSGAPSLVLKEAATFSRVAFHPPTPLDKKSPKLKLPLYIAIASSSMKLIEGTILKHLKEEEIYESGAFKAVLEALAEPIVLKYDSKPSSTSTPKARPLWIQATKTSLSILEPCLQVMDTMKSLEDDVRIDIWNEAVSLSTSVVAANATSISEDTLLTDEAFDIDAFTRLRSVLVPRLGRSIIPDVVISQYVEKVFKASLLYKVSDEYLGPAPLSAEQLLKPCIGRTSEPILQRRMKMSYVCIDELFALSEKRTQDDERSRLAKITAPFLVQRLALVLRHFAADQPLRGKMPQPRRLRKELLYILKKSITLEAQPEAAAPALESGTLLNATKWHLRSVFPLISRAVAVAETDNELLVLFSNALDELV